MSRRPLVPRMHGKAQYLDATWCPARGPGGHRCQRLVGHGGLHISARLGVIDEWGDVLAPEEVG